MLIHAGEVESEKELQGSGCLEILSGPSRAHWAGRVMDLHGKGGPVRVTVTQTICRQNSKTNTQPCPWTILYLCSTGF